MSDKNTSDMLHVILTPKVAQTIFGGLEDSVGKCNLKSPTCSDYEHSDIDTQYSVFQRLWLLDPPFPILQSETGLQSTKYTWITCLTISLDKGLCEDKKSPPYLLRVSCVPVSLQFTFSLFLSLYHILLVYIGTFVPLNKLTSTLLGKNLQENFSYPRLSFSSFLMKFPGRFYEYLLWN